MDYLEQVDADKVTEVEQVDGDQNTKVKNKESYIDQTKNIIQKQIAKYADNNNISLSRIAYSIVPEEGNQNQCDLCCKISGGTDGMMFRLTVNVNIDLAQRKTEFSNMEVAMSKEVIVELGYAFNIMSDSYDIAGFFQCLSSYATWCQNRSNVFEQLVKHYPNFVTLNDSSDRLLEIHNAAKTGVWFCLAWNHVVENNSVIPAVELLTRGTNLEMTDEEKVMLQSSDHHFQLMVEHFGIQKAIAMIVETIANS